MFMYPRVFMFWLFGHEAGGIIAAQPGIKPALIALEVLTTGPPGKSLISGFLSQEIHPIPVSNTAAQFFLDCFLPDNLRALLANWAFDKMTSFQAKDLTIATCSVLTF